MRRILKIAAAILVLGLALISIRVVKAGQGSQIVSTDIVKLDSLTTQLRMVSPDEIQRLENERAADISDLRRRIELLELRVAALEGEGE